MGFSRVGVCVADGATTAIALTAAVLAGRLLLPGGRRQEGICAGRPDQCRDVVEDQFRYVVEVQCWTVPGGGGRGGVQPFRRWRCWTEPGGGRRGGVQPCWRGSRGGGGGLDPEAVGDEAHGGGLHEEFHMHRGGSVVPPQQRQSLQPLRRTGKA